jgi:hypothetical protein
MTLLDFNWIFSRIRKSNPEKNGNPVFSGFDRPQRLGPNPEKIQIIRFRTSFLQLLQDRKDTVFFFFVTKKL